MTRPVREKLVDVASGFEQLGQSLAVVERYGENFSRGWVNRVAILLRSKDLPLNRFSKRRGDGNAIDFIGPMSGNQKWRKHCRRQVGVNDRGCLRR
jgi:hypothetical protein